MRRATIKLLGVLALGLFFCLPEMAFGDILNFDDIVVPDLTYQGQLAPKINDYSTNYGGFTWTSTSTSGYWGVETSNSYILYGNTTTPITGAALFPSMNNVVINEDGNIGAGQTAISSNNPFNFDGAYFGAWTQNDNSIFYGASSITINGYLNNALIGTQTFNISPGSLQWVAGTLKGINKLEFLPTDGSGGYYFLMDNFTYSQAPIPASVLLLGSGLLGMGLVGRRRQRS
jgi:hypothetical protein